MGNSAHKGNIRLGSPADVAVCLNTPHHYGITIRESRFDVVFEQVYGLLMPETLTIVVLMLRQDDEHDSEEPEHFVESTYTCTIWRPDRMEPSTK